MIVPVNTALELTTSGRPANTLSAIISGHRAITPDTAIRLSCFFGNSAEFWTNLQAGYDLKMAKLLSEKKIKLEVIPFCKQKNASKMKAQHSIFNDEPYFKNMLELRTDLLHALNQISIGFSNAKFMNYPKGKHMILPDKMKACIIQIKGVL